MIASSIAKNAGRAIASPITGDSSEWTPAQLSLDLRLKADQGVGAGGARLFVATDKACLTLADFAAVDFSTTDFAISVCIERTTTGNQVIAAKYESATDYWKLEIDASHKAHFIAVVGGVTKVEVTGTTALSTLATWQHLIVSVDRDTAATTFMYLDGVDDTAGTPTVSTDDIDNTGALFVGQLGDDTLYLDAALSRLGTWKAATHDAAQALTLYALGQCKLHAELTAAELVGLTAYWNLIEGNATDVAFDAVGSNDLTPTFAEMVTNGGFDADTDWGKGAGWSIAAGVASAAAADANLTQTGTTFQAALYDTSFAISNYVGGSVMIEDSGNNPPGTSRSANGTHTEQLLFVSNKTLRMDPVGFTGDIDDVSVKATGIAAADGPRMATASDIVGGNHGVLTDMDTVGAWVTDKPAALTSSTMALQLDGVDDYVAIPGISEAGVFSLSMWFKADAIAGGLLGTSGAANNTLKLQSTTVIRFDPASTSDFTVPAMSTDTYYHLVLTRDGSDDCRVYLNGVESSTGALNNIGQFDPTAIGVNNTAFFGGMVDDIRFYSTQLSEAQATALFTDTAPPTPDVAHWDFEDGPQNISGVSDGDHVLSWKSIEGNSILFNQATSGKRPTYTASVANSKSGITFQGVSQLLRAAAAHATGTLGDVYVFFMLDGTGGDEWFISSADEGTANEYMALGKVSTEQILYEHNDTGTVDALRGDTTVMTTATAYMARFSSDDSTITLELNGGGESIVVVAGTNAGKWWDDAINLDNMVLGALKHTSEQEFFEGKLLEVAVSPTQLDATDNTRMIAYALSEYGI